MKFGLCMMEIRGLGVVTIALTEFSIICMNVSVFLHCTYGLWFNLDFREPNCAQVMLYDCALSLN